MSQCNLCPRKCNIDRQNHAGFCGEGTTMRISRAALHFWEEPCISGTGGSGAIFFTGCNLKCIFCQNAAISENGPGREISVKELCDIFFDLKNQGAHNINLVTPSHFVPGIRESILLAKEKGFDLPFVYNSSAYESVETLRTLEGLIDIYLPDFKYMDSGMAKNYSHAADYPEVAKIAVAEMVRQTGSFVFADSLMKRGVIVRHLLLPLGVKNAVSVIDCLYDTYGDNIWLSLMSQYTPLYDSGTLSSEQKKRLAPFPELHRKVTKREYNKLLNHCFDRNIQNVFIQEGDVALDSFIPAFRN
ncbi:MAG: 4Fe-4S cluster-binding domain-containing protein [Lachnospiraceae bacterium]|nr:4Fe-4S cluster-binding domain-containing protein [Lachnospiraceae bacterium]